MSPKAVALAVTSYHGPFYEDGKKTGAFYSEVLHPFDVFTKAGYKVDIVSETGSFGWDEHSIEPSFATEEELSLKSDPNSDFYKAIKSIKKASETVPGEYSVFYAAGGHGTIFDFDKAPGLFKLAGAIWDAGGIVAAVCHGPIILSGIKDSKEQLIAKDKKITGFSDDGEKAMNLTKLLDKNGWAYTSGFLEKLGDYEPPKEPFGAKVVVDGRLATGANPASAAPLAETVLKLQS